MKIPHSSTRHGTILIIVAGICALLAGLSLTFLTRMRSDVQESQLVIQEAQARIMLSAACCYLLEASRLGYDTLVYDRPGIQGVGEARATENKNFHLEGHGWIDVRDGTVGPKADFQAFGPIDVNDTTNIFYLDANTNRTPPNGYSYNQSEGSSTTSFYNKYFPIGASRRFDMYMKKIPPFAIRMDVAPNPIITDPTNSNFGIPYLSRPDPIPVITTTTNWDWNSATSATTEQAFAEFKRGDPTPVANSTGMAWFRLHRCGPGYKDGLGRVDTNYSKYNAATFIVTVGVGGTQGFRSYTNDYNLSSDEERAICANTFQNQQIFNAIQASELRQWYLVEWSAAVGGQLVGNNDSDQGNSTDGEGEYFANSHYAQMPQNRSRSGRDSASQGKMKNMGGTIRYVQRLLVEPKEW
jgi:hypothetical protein